MPPASNSAADGTLFLANAGWLWPMVGLGILALIVLALGYRRISIPQPWKAVAFLLKAIGLLLLALVLLEPMWTGESPKKGANDLVILADNSAGLSIEDAGKEMKDLLAGPEPGTLPEWLDQAQETFRLQTYRFGEQLERTADYTSLDFTDTSSALETALGSLRERYEKRPLAGIFVFTDGNATDSALEETGTRFYDRAPVFPVIVGRKENAPGKDVSISGISVTQSPFEDAPVTIAADVTKIGDVGLVTAIVFDDAEREILREPVEFGDTDNTRRIRLLIPAVKPGVSFFKVKVEQDQPELTLKNNERLVSVDRGRGPYRILYITGRPNWEYKYLRRAVSLDPEIDLVALVRIAKREPKFEWRGREGESNNPLFRGFNPDVPEEAQRYDQPVMIRLNTRDAEELRDGFPKEEDALFDDYRAIILDDVEAEFFTTEQQNLLERFVSTRGGTVVMLGGQESYQAGGWDHTPVGEMLPVYLDKLSAGRPALAAIFNLSREGWLEPWMRLRTKQDDDEIRLAHMPPFYAVNQVQAIKPGASVLATVTDSDRQQHPAVVTQRYGEGRTASILIGDFWRWGMEDETNRIEMEKAWRQILRWSVVDVPDRTEVTLTAVSEGAIPKMAFSTRVRDETFRVQDDASVRISIVREGVENTDDEVAPIYAEPSLEEGGLFEADYYPNKAGGYRATIEARDNEGQLIGETAKERGWALNPEADEFRSLTPDRARLEAIASATGGQVLELSEVKEFVANLTNLEVPVTETWTRPFWHAPWLFALALVCFAGEWFVRRWKGGVL